MIHYSPYKFTMEKPDPNLPFLDTEVFSIIKDLNIDFKYFISVKFLFKSLIILFMMSQSTKQQKYL